MSAFTALSNEELVKLLADEEAALAAIQAQLGVTGKTCKGCHDEYKAKDYLY